MLKAVVLVTFLLLSSKTVPGKEVNLSHFFLSPQERGLSLLVDANQPEL